jgi:ribosomal protein S18 acetylase RimI-like enzyme
MTSLPLALRAPDPRIAIRPVKISDTESLRVHCWPNRKFMAVYGVVSRAARSMAQERGLGLVITSAEGLAIGFGQYSVWPACAEISDLVVSESHRGQGLGTTLIQALLQHGLQRGITTFEIGVALDNPRAAALYRRLGFVDSHTVLLHLDRGPERVQFLRLSADAPAAPAART